MGADLWGRGAGHPTDLRGTSLLGCLALLDNVCGEVIANRWHIAERSCLTFAVELVVFLCECVLFGLFVQQPKTFAYSLGAVPQTERGHILVNLTCVLVAQACLDQACIIVRHTNTIHQ